MPIGTAGGPRRWSSGSNFTPQQPPRPPPGGRRVGERWNKRRNNGDEKTGFGKPPIFEGIISVPLVIDDVTLTPRNTLLE